MTTDSTQYYDKRAFEHLNNFLQEQIILMKSRETISRISFIDINKEEKLKALALNLEIEHFQSGDIVLKQGDYGHKFCFIIDGLMEVILENKDYRFYDQNNVNQFYGTNNSNKEIPSFKRLNALRDRGIFEEQSFHNLIPIEKIFEDSSSEWGSYEEESKDVASDENKEPDPFSDSSAKVLHEFENYTVLNEFSRGDFFGEISCLTKYLPVTCTIRAISNSVCGVIYK